MSKQSAAISDALFDYIRQHAIPEDETLASLRAEAPAAGLPQIWIAPEQGAFLQTLIRIHGSREVLEVGTLGGYSAIWMARGLPKGGRLRTIELEPTHADFAERHIRGSDVADQIEVLRGNGRDVIPRISDASIDAMFIDADKLGYRQYVEEGLRIVRPGGLILIDNAFGFGQVLDREVDEDVLAIRELNGWIADHPRLLGVIAPFGDGCQVLSVLAEGT